MLFYQIASLMFIGISHIYLYILCIRYRRMSYTLLSIISFSFIALLGTAVTMTGYPELNIILLTLFLLALGYLHKPLSFLHNLFFALFSIVTYTLVKLLLLQLAVEIFMVLPFNLYIWTESLLHFIVAVTLLAGIIVFRKKVEQFSAYIVKSKFYIPAFILLVTSTFLILIINYPSSALLSSIYYKYGNASYAAVLILFFLLVIIFVLSYHLSKEHLAEEHEQQMQGQLMDYAKKLEELHDELASFRHDYMNILLSLEEGIRTRNLAQIEHVYDDVIKPASRFINHHELEITKLSRIVFPEIKSIVSVKVLSAQQKKLNVSIDIPDQINRLYLPPDKLVRILSILLDNAMEEAMHTQDKQLQISIFEWEECQYFIVRNSSSQSNIDLQDIFRKKKSSKGNGRGYGLFSLKRMVDQLANVTLETTFDPPAFTQTVAVKKHGAAFAAKTTEYER